MNRNIPLVQDNSVNSINTSLCAINRAIGQNGVPEVNVNVNYNVTDEVSADNIYPVTSRGVKAALDDLDETVNGLIDDLSETVTEHSTITTSSDSTPYSQRINADKDKSFINKLIGASFAVNQLVKNGNFANTSNWSFTTGTVSVSNGTATLTASSQYGWIVQSIPVRKGHKMLVIGTCKSYTNTRTQIKLRQTRPSNSYYDTSRTLSTTETTYAFVVPIVNDLTYCQVAVQDNNTSGWGAITVKNVQVIDLTQMFGSAIADRIYAMEQATAGSGIAWIKSFGFFNNAYYSTDEGSLQSAKPSAYRTTGFNIARSWTNGSVSTQYSTALAVDCELRPATTYCIGFKGANNNRLFHNENLFKNDFSQIVVNGQYQYYLLTTKDDISSQYNAGLGYVILKNNAGNSVTPNFTQVCISLADSRFNGQYEKYIGEWNYPLAGTELRGIPKLDSNNNLYYDGDVYYPNGDVVRKYETVALSTLTKNYHLSGGSTGGLGWVDFILSSIKRDTLNMLLSQSTLPCKTGSAGWQSTTPCMSAGINDNNVGIFRIYETSGMSQADFDAKYNSATLIYELATPTKETVAGYSNPHTLIRKGAEEFVDNRTIALPVGHETEYAQLPSWLSNNVIFL